MTSTSSAAAATAEPYATRCDRVQKRMRSEGLDLLYIGHSTDLEHLTGVVKPGRSYGPARYFAHWTMGAVLGPEGAPIILIPRHLAEHGCTPGYGELRVIMEDDSPAELMLRAISDTAGEWPERIGVNYDAEAELVVTLSTAVPGARVEMATDLLAADRAIKSEDELAALQRAIEVTERVYREAVDRISSAITTKELSIFMTTRIRELAEDQSFTPSVAAVGEGIDRPGGFPTRGSVLIDFGVAVDGYCTDIGRTLHIGPPTQRYLDAYKVALEAQTVAAAALKPGTPASEVDKIARTIVEDAGYGEWFRHRTGHGLGRDVNEPPYLESVDDTPLQTGMVFTVEPGIMKRDEFLVFIEDIYVVTDSGGKRLTTFSTALEVL
jgi:Xaa-Pro aminopeptidase